MKLNIEDEEYEIEFISSFIYETIVTCCKIYKIINGSRVSFYSDSKYRFDVSKLIKHQIIKYLDETSPDIFSFSVELDDTLVKFHYELFLRSLYCRYDDHAYTTDKENIRFFILSKSEDIPKDIIDWIKKN